MNTLTMYNWYRFMSEAMHIQLGILPLYLNFPIYMDSDGISLITSSRTIFIERCRIEVYYLLP